MAAQRLTAEEEARLAGLIQAGRQPGASALAKRQGKKAEDEFIVGNLGLVYRIANKFQRTYLELDDMIQEGTLGLMHALELFDWTKGVKFSTYADNWIRHYITRAIANQGRMIRLPVHIDDAVRKLRRVRNQLDVELGRTATDEEVAEDMGISVEAVRQLDHYDEPLASLSSSERDFDVAAPSVEDAEPGKDVSSLLATLNDKQRTAIELKFGLGPPQADIAERAKIIGITEDGVKRRERTAMLKMREAA